MDECEQVEKRVDLRVRTSTDPGSPASEADELQAEQSGVLVEPPKTDPFDESAQSGASAAQVSALQLHMSAAQMKPLPARIIAGASFGQVLNRPAPMLGQALCIFLFVAALAYLWAHHMLVDKGSSYLFMVPSIIVLFFAVPLFGLMKMQAKLLAELFAGALHPLSIFDRGSLQPVSAGLLGDALQGHDKYLHAACCYAEVLRFAHAIEVLSKNRSFERELIISLAFAGKFKQSHSYADNAVRYADYLLSTVDTEATRNYFAFATRTAAMAYELAGENAKSLELRERCYEATKDLPLSNESRLFGNLAKAEAYCLEREFDKALPLLKDFVQNVSSGHRMSNDPVLKSRGCHLLAVCHAHFADFEEARKMHKQGCEMSSSDLSTYSKAEGIWAEAQILKYSGQTVEADSLIDKSLKKLQVLPCSVIWQRLNSLQGQPSNVSSILSVHDENEVRYDYDDEPVPAPILSDDQDKIDFVKRTTLSVLFVSLIALFTPGGQGYLLFLVPAFVYALYVLHAKSKQKDASATAILNGTPLLVKVKLSGYKDLHVFRDDGQGEHYEAQNAEQWTNLVTIGGNKKLEAVAYVDASGEIAAVQVIGHYSSVKRGKRMNV